MSETTTGRKQLGAYSVKTWADGFGVWHCEVLVSEVSDDASILAKAREAIADEIRQRGNGAPTEEYLSSNRFWVQYLTQREVTAAGIRYVLREGSDDELNDRAMDIFNRMLEATGDAGVDGLQGDTENELKLLAARIERQG